MNSFDPQDYLERKAAQRMARFSQMAVAASGMALADSGLDLAKRLCTEGAGVPFIFITAFPAFEARRGTWHVIAGWRCLDYRMKGGRPIQDMGLSGGLLTVADPTPQATLVDHR